MIWDAFMFRNEFDCLEIRLHELDPYVDRFVLVEADFTFQGGEKPFHFAEHKDRYRKFLDRIMHVKREGPVQARDAWEREALQRNAIKTGLKEAKPGDMVLVGDADEIPRGSSIPDAAQMIRKDPSLQVSFDQVLSFYHVNNVCPTPWYGTQAVSAGQLHQRGAEHVRQSRGGGATLPRSGWHFCNLGDPAWLIEKIESFSHTEVNLPQYKDPEFLQRCIDEGREMTGRTDIQFTLEENPDLPRYLTQERFPHLFAEVRATA